MASKEMVPEEAIGALAELYDQSTLSLVKAIKSIGKEMAAGKASGRIELNHKNGNRSTVLRYTKGKLDGAIETYHENGLPAGLHQYRLGDRHGLSIRCAEDGEVVQVLAYNRDKLDGPCFRKQPGTGDIHLDILRSGTMGKDECRVLEKDADQVLYNWALRMVQSMVDAVLCEAYGDEQP